MLAWIYCALMLVLLGVVIWLGIVLIKEEVKNYKEEKEYNSHFVDTGDKIIFSITSDGSYNKELWNRLYTNYFSFKRRKDIGIIPKNKIFVLKLTVVDKTFGTSEVMEYNMENHKLIRPDN